MKDIKDLLNDYRSTQAELENLRLHRDDTEAFLFPDGNVPEELRGRLQRIQDRKDEQAKHLKENLEAVLKIIKAMENEEHRTVLALRYIKGLTWQEIGELTGYSAQHVRGKLFRAAIKEAKGVLKNEIDRTDQRRDREGFQ